MARLENRLEWINFLAWASCPLIFLGRQAVHAALFELDFRKNQYHLTPPFSVRPARIKGPSLLSAQTAGTYLRPPAPEA